MIHKHHWFFALVIAFTLHAAAFVTLSSTSPTESAKDKGKFGIEVDLGMLGDLGVAMAEPVTQEVVAEKEPEPEVEPEIQPPEVVEPEQVEPEPIPEPIKVDPKPVVQKNDVQIKKQVKKPKLKVEKEKVKKEQPKERPKTVVAEKKEVTREATKSTEKSNASTSTSRDKKITTGSENTISAGGQKGAERSYFSELSAQLARHKRYPNRARKRNEEGLVMLFITINRDGKVIESYISKSSGHSKLDKAVLSMLEKASPLPAFPDEMKQSQLSINIPIDFKLNN